MAEKHTTLVQLQKLARRGKVDVLTRIGKLQELVIQGLEEVQHTGIAVTLPVTDWENKTQTVKDPSLLADGSHCYFAYGDIGVDAYDVTVDGQITFRCDDVPDRNLMVKIIRLEISTEDSSEVGKVFNLTSNENLKTYIDKRFGDFYDALITEGPLYFGLCDSDSRAILDSDENGITGQIIFQIKQ